MEKEDVNNALLHIKSKHNGEIPYKYGSQECAKLMHSYANERVIEELEKLKDNYIDLWELTDDLDKRIKELKQQIWKEHTKQSSGYLKDISKTK